MQPYHRSLNPEVYGAQRRLQLVLATATRDEGTTVADVAAQEGVSESLLYQLQRRVQVALTPAKPGPKGRPQPTLPPRVVATTFTPTPLDPATLTYVLHTEHVSIRGIQRVFDVFDRPVPARDTLVAQTHAAGRAARRLLERAKKQLRDRLVCLAADDIFLRRVPVKVVMDPVSGAVLEVWRWPKSHTAEDWRLFLEEWPALKVLVSDLGTDLVKAARLLRTRHQADLFHERQWWNEKVFAPLARWEARLAKGLATLWERATRPGRAGRTVSLAKLEGFEQARAEAESAFYAAVEAEEHLRPLFESLDPHGDRWTPTAIEDRLTYEVCPRLAKLPDAVGERAWKHVWRHRRRWCAHRVLWDHIPVHLRPGSSWTPRRVIETVLAVWKAERQFADATNWTQGRAAQDQVRTLRTQLAAECVNLAAVEAQARSLRDRPRRSSSLVESFNAVVRGLQQVHRTVSDDLLALEALRWNLSPRTEGSRRGPSPFALLGVDFADDTRPWYEVLIDEINRE